MRRSYWISPGRNSSSLGRSGCFRELLSTGDTGDSGVGRRILGGSAGEVLLLCAPEIRGVGPASTAYFCRWLHSREAVRAFLKQSWRLQGYRSWNAPWEAVKDSYELVASGVKSTANVHRRWLQRERGCTEVAADAIAEQAFVETIRQRGFVAPFKVSSENYAVPLRKAMHYM